MYAKLEYRKHFSIFNFVKHTLLQYTFTQCLIKTIKKFSN